MKVTAVKGFQYIIINLTYQKLIAIISDRYEKISYKQFIEILIVYNFFIFNPAQRKYFIYKRKLYVVIKFCRKYKYLYKHFYQITIIYMNYKLLTHFLDFNLYKGIYENWIDQLWRLNFNI